MIPNGILDVCESFDLSSKEMVTVLAEEPVNRFFRQYSSCFDVIIGRTTQISRCRAEEEYKAVCHDICENGKMDDVTNEYLRELGVEYIISECILENSEWVLCKKQRIISFMRQKGRNDILLSDISTHAHQIQ